MEWRAGTGDPAAGGVEGVAGQESHPKSSTWLATSFPTVKLRFLFFALLFLLSACGNSVGALSVSAAQDADDGRIKVTGWFRASAADDTEQVLLCAGLADAEEGTAPPCEEPFIEIMEVSPGDLPLQAESVSGGMEYWSEERVVLDLDKAGDAYVFAGLSE